MHIQIKWVHNRQFVNTDCIETVTETEVNPPEVSIIMRDGGETLLRGEEATAFLAQYIYFCVEKQRPEVG